MGPLEFWTKLGARPQDSKTKGPDPTRFHRVGSGPPHFIPICHGARGALPIVGGPLRLVLLAISYSWMLRWGVFPGAVDGLILDWLPR